MTVGVIGLGLIGGSIAQRLAPVVGFDSDGAERAGVEQAASVDEVAAACELVVVAVPPGHAGETVAAVLDADPRVLVTDVTSVKGPVLDEVRRRSPLALGRFLPSHPLAGAETAGWEAARADLLEGTTWAVCPPAPDAPPEPLCRFGELFDAFDARLILCDARKHDLALARTSHAPHLIAVAMAASLEGSPLAAALSGGAFRDMTRVARSDRGLWSEILELNRVEVEAVLDEWDELSRSASSAVWTDAQTTVELVERLRWSEPRWEQRSFGWPAWNDLLALGREGAAIRRPRLDGGRLSADVVARA